MCAIRDVVDQLAGRDLLTVGAGINRKDKVVYRGPIAEAKVGGDEVVLCRRWVAVPNEDDRDLLDDAAPRWLWHQASEEEVRLPANSTLANGRHAHRLGGNFASSEEREIAFDLDGDRYWRGIVCVDGDTVTDDDVGDRSA